MPKHHLLPGKDAPLETSIERLQSLLKSAGFHVEERSWLNPVEGVWSVHLVDADCPLLFTNGKGASQLAARASALGEFVERLACNYFWAHYYLGASLANARFVHHPRERWFPLAEDAHAWPAELLTDALRAFYDPERAIPAARLVDFNSGHRQRGLCALPFTRLKDGAPVWFPVNIVNNLYVSNGMSAGNSPAEARAQALSEIVERHVKFRVFREGLCLPEVPEEVVDRHPHIAEGIRSLREAGFGVLVKDASLGGQWPVLCVTLLNPRDQGCYASFGAHPRFSVALERALTELLQGRALDRLDGFPEPGFDDDEVASAPNLEIHFVNSSGLIGWNFLADTPDFAFCDWNFSATTAEDYDWLAGAIHAAGYDLYVADYPHLGAYACRVLVPGFSEIYPVDDLDYENNSVGATLRAPILRLSQLDVEECETLLDALDAAGIDEQRPVATLIGLAPDPGSVWEELRVGELKTRLALAVGDLDAARRGCEWIGHFGHIDEKRARLYRCVAALLAWREENSGHDPYRHALTLLYGEATLARAEALADGEECFADLGAPGENLVGFALHARLLAAYAKARRLHGEPL